MRIRTIALLGALGSGLAGCYTDRAILTNDQGETQTCEGRGWIGIIGPIVAHERLKDCVDKAKANGFKESPTASR